MAAYMRGVLHLISIERNAFLTKSNSVTAESKRFLRGLRRKPVRVTFPDSEAGKVLERRPQSQPAQQRDRTEAKVTSTVDHLDESVVVKTRSSAKSPVKQATLAKNQVDGLRFDRAFPGDKRLA